jgi:hypothetical protein
MARGVLPAWWLGVGLTTPHRKKIRLLLNTYISLGLGWILWIIGLSYGIWK